MSDRPAQTQTPSELERAAKVELETLGIDWPNLFVLSRQRIVGTAATGRAGGAAEGEGIQTDAPDEWVFRIELDTRIDEDKAQILQDLLSSSDPEKWHEATLNLIRWRKSHPVEAAMIHLALALPPSESIERIAATRSSTTDAPVAPVPEVVVLQDFGKDSSWKSAIRVHFDIPLRADGPDNPAEIRKMSRKELKAQMLERNPAAKRGEALIEATLGNLTHEQALQEGSQEGTTKSAGS